MRLIIVGVGLLGSSLGLAAKKHGLVESVVGIGRRPESLEIARNRGAIDVVATDFSIVAGMGDALAVVCTPVGRIAADAKRLAEINPDLLLSDVGSTKAGICRAVTEIGCRFVGAHPIAGSEKSGPEFGDADLFQNRLTILTPDKRNRPEDVERLRRFWTKIGSRVVCMEPELHDRILAKTSHLPHAVAATLASLPTEEERPFSGTGFASTTRIAAGPPEVWTDIFLENRLPLLDALNEFTERLERLRNAIKNGDTEAVAEFLREAQERPRES